MIPTMEGLLPLILRGISIRVDSKYFYANCKHFLSRSRLNLGTGGVTCDRDKTRDDFSSRSHSSPPRLSPTQSLSPRPSCHSDNKLNLNMIASPQSQMPNKRSAADTTRVMAEASFLVLVAPVESPVEPVASSVQVAADHINLGFVLV